MLISQNHFGWPKAKHLPPVTGDCCDLGRFMTGVAQSIRCHLRISVTRHSLGTQETVPCSCSLQPQLRHSRGVTNEVIMKACDELIDYLIRHIDGSLSNSEAASFHNHLHGCPGCRFRHRELRRMVRPKSGAECQTCDGFLAAASGVGSLGLAVLSSRCRDASALTRSQTRLYGMQCDTFRRAVLFRRCAVPSRRITRWGEIEVS